MSCYNRITNELLYSIFMSSLESILIRVSIELRVFCVVRSRGVVSVLKSPSASVEESSGIVWKHCFLPQTKQHGCSSLGGNLHYTDLLPQSSRPFSQDTLLSLFQCEVWIVAMLVSCGQILVLWMRRSTGLLKERNTLSYEGKVHHGKR